MSFSFSDQQSLLSILLGDSNTNSDDAWPLAIRKKYINRGEFQFAKDSKLVREKATGTVSSNQISLPTDWIETITLIVGNFTITKDREVSIQDYERFYNYAGSPVYYFMSEESGTRYFKFFGTATGSTYSLYYVKKPSTELSSDSDTSIFPEEFREASVYWAASELFQQVGNNQISDRFLAKYIKFVRDAQMRSEEMYMTKSYPVPDVNLLGDYSTDRQGQGYDYA